MTGDEIAGLGGTNSWALIPADPMGTTVRRLATNRICVRNHFAFRPDLAVSEGDLAKAKHLHQRSFDRRFPMLKDVELQYTWGGALVPVGEQRRALRATRGRRIRSGRLQWPGPEPRIGVGQAHRRTRARAIERADQSAAETAASALAADAADRGRRGIGGNLGEGILGGRRTLNL